MNLSDQKALVPHYLAVFVLALVAVGGTRAVAGSVPVWTDLLVVVLLVLSYPSLVRVLGVAPDVWEEADRQ